MKKFIITEEEKNRILGMHEDHGYNSLNEQIAKPENSNDPGINNTKQQQFKNQADILFNKIITNNPAEKYTQEEFATLPALRRDFPNSTIFYTVNGRFYQYPKGVTKGEPTIKGSWKLENNKIVTVKDAAYNKPVVTEPAKTGETKKPALKAAGQSTPNTTGSSIGVIYKYEYPNDKKYRYGVKDGKWFGKNLANGKEFDLSTITTTITNLNNKFPNAMTQQETPVEPELVAKPVAPSANALAASEPPTAPA